MRGVAAAEAPFDHPPFDGARHALYLQQGRAEHHTELGVVLGAPLLQIERVARTVEGRVVEWRLSRCDTTHLSYAVTLS